MSKERRVTWLVALLLLAVALLVSLLTWGSHDRRLGGSGTAALGAGERFAISGAVSQPMRPGVQVPIDLKVTNPYDVAISVSHVAIAVTAIRSSTPDLTTNCAVEDFRIDQLAADRTIAVGRSSSVSLSSLGRADTWPAVGLRNRAVNQDACKNVTVELAYTARARRAD
jgi:hypothetical protein